MTLAFFTVAITASALLEWQRRRHKLETEALCTRLEISVPPLEPRVGVPEALLTAYLGLLGLIFGGVAAWASIESAGVLRGELADGSLLMDGPYQLMVVLIGGGAALLGLGLRALSSIRSHTAGAGEPDLPPSSSRYGRRR